MEVPIIRICKIGFFGLSLTALLASPAIAKRGDGALTLNKYVEARLAELSDQPEVATAIYSQSLKEEPNNSLLAGKAYVKAIETGNFDLALKAVRLLELRGQIDPEMPLLSFADSFARGDWRTADTALVQLETLENFAFMAPFLNAWIETARGGNPEIHLESAKANKTAKFYYDEQLILQKLAQNDDSAAPLVDEVVKRNEPRMAPIRIMAARHYLAKKDVERALTILESGRTGPETRLRRAIKAGAVKDLGRKIDAQSGAAFLFQRLSSDLGAQRAHFLSLVTAQMGIRINPGTDYAHLILGQAYGKAENSKFAYEEFGKLPETSPYFLIALNSEVLGRIENREFDQAIARLDTRIRKDKTAPEPRILKGQVLQVAGNHKAAVDEFSEAITLAEKRGYSDRLLASYWLSLGGAQEQAGIWPEGLRSLQRANELRPNSASILNYLGYAQLERRENTEEAVASIREAHKLRSRSPAITDSLGWAYFLTGEHERAVDYLETALAGQPYDPTINEHLGDAYWTVGRKYEARYAWKSAKLFAEDEEIERLSKKIDIGLRPDLVSP